MANRQDPLAPAELDQDPGVFDFDYWMELHRSDPAEFEHQRAACMQAMIDSAPPEFQTRLQGMMFEINHRRQLQSAHSSYLHLAERMWEKLEELQQQMRRLFEPADADETNKTAPQSAEVLDFKAKPVKKP